ncbi:transcription-repair coupling factor [Candidatus Magnetominusculus xianensis]|uniref:Transcription-repair-coupling factor n=1 Tax=Candidatus Magnetominusculus xianensis TaxID=1748249 RepID=A0ABR5SHG7_9BACT|nr:transcription-repair coupling factor [Candidatus Magnetominusculus xianensis]KWT91115.1 transcription-repair coupling factor [Candidatus Magnetominusculus xianensis]MBF0403240.1 transcription-repair coupling factor [Nitrospirota bacterium]
MPLLLTQHRESFLLITNSDDDFNSLSESYDFFAAITGAKPILRLPAPDDSASTGALVEILATTDKGASAMASIKTITTPLNISQLDYFLIKKGDEKSREDSLKKLLSFGYKQTALVIDKGECSLRNYILDFYPVSKDNPVRIEFFGDEVDSIREFSVETQRTTKTLDEISIFPLIFAAGPIDSQSSLIELFDVSRVFIFAESAAEGKAFLKTLPAAPPVTVLSDTTFDTTGVDARSLSLSGLGVLLEERTSVSEIPQAVSGLLNGCRVMIVSATKAQGERLKDIFIESNMPVPVIKKEDAATYEGNIFITVGMLNEGLYIDGLIVLTETEIFGEVQRHRTQKKPGMSNIFKILEELKPGDYIVHFDHGIGIFEGLRQEQADNFVYDMLIIRYADDARLYVPVGSINLIKKYWAEEGVLPRLDKLGGKTWQRAKGRAKKRIEILAEKLIAHYAEREVAKGFALSPDGPLHAEFDDFFPYEPTPDQISAAVEIKKDMESDKPMDRLLCGDVGYGKTEVAMRAAFKAVFDGRQVAVLVPTTILCEQHYLNFKERFSPFPVKVDYISRFKMKSKADETLKKLAKGEIDIIIGTQSLLRKNLDIPALGLLIIDEEHRFGVAQKERIKELKTGVHCLTLSATPIPRTLQMSLSGIWKMSAIETAPELRQSVRTNISVFDQQIIKEALHRELQRGGQVFFVHNRIKDIDKIAAMVKGLVKDKRVAVGHGQMNNSELEEIMLDFIKKKIDILVSTAIIGSGIDIPTANTIIVNRADTMGLADLYQLRGRVGRSNVKAYAYFFIPGEDLISADAKKRLTAIQELSYLGAGLRLALKDMEIRGAGNMLGAEQSGHIHALGFDTYMEMLEEEISRLKGIPIEKEKEPVIELKIEAHIPEGYVDEVSVRLNFYRRLALAKEEADIFDLEDEIIDRFGKLPAPAEALFNLMRVKILCKKIRAASVKRLTGKVQVQFFEEGTDVLARMASEHKKYGHKLHFLPLGFEIMLKNIGIEEIPRLLIGLFKTIAADL